MGERKEKGRRKEEESRGKRRIVKKGEQRGIVEKEGIEKKRKKHRKQRVEEYGRGRWKGK